MSEPIDIRTTIGARLVSRPEVLAWEFTRTAKVLTKFRSRLGARAMAELLPNVSVEELLEASPEVQRSALATVKGALGPAGLYALFKREIAISERAARIGVATSRGRTRTSVTRLHASGRSAHVFADWFNTLTTSNRERDMVSACPDHFLLRRMADGRQEVLETTGGAPTASRFIIDYGDLAALNIPEDPAYPVQISGVAVLDDGVVIGGVRHQFRDGDGGVDALLTVQFPFTTPSRLVDEHRWHLACEFGNWIIAAPTP